MWSTVVLQRCVSSSSELLHTRRLDLNQNTEEVGTAAAASFVATLIGGGCGAVGSWCCFWFFFDLLPALRPLSSTAFCPAVPGAFISPCLSFLVFSPGGKERIRTPVIVVIVLEMSGWAKLQYYSTPLPSSRVAHCQRSTSLCSCASRVELN